MDLPSQSFTMVGLNSFTFIATQAGPFVLDGKISLPTITNGGGPSSCVATVKQNGTIIYTGVAGAEGFRTDIGAALNDSIQILLTSAAAADQPINAIKSTIIFTPGV